MVRSCWTSYQSGGDYGMWTIHYTLNGAPDQAELPIPDYIIRDLSCCNTTPYGFGYQGTLLNAMSSARWGHFCNAIESTPWERISTGPYSLDVGTTGGDVRSPTSTTFIMSAGHAIATRFTPMSRFVPYIVLHDVVSLLSGNKTVVEIRANDTNNLPVGVPGDNNVLARCKVTLPAQLFVDAGGGWTTTIYNQNVAIPINAIIAGTDFVPDTPYWIVMYDGDRPFFCSSSDIGGIYERVKFSTANTGRNDTALWSSTSGCNSWAMTTSINSISFATYNSSTGNGVVNITDFGFAEMTPTPSYLNTNCFGSRIAMQSKNVAVGIDFEVPRHYQKISFSIAFDKPDGRRKGFTYDLTDVALGFHQIYVDIGEEYMPGVYTNLAVVSSVLIV